MNQSMIQWGQTNLMWLIPKKCTYLLARNATCAVSFEWHLRRITLTSFHQNKICFVFGQEVASPSLSVVSHKRNLLISVSLEWRPVRCNFLQSPKWTVSFSSVSSHFTTADLVSLSMLIICPRWIQCFPWFSTLTQLPTQTHKASQLVDFFFFAPKESNMIQDDAILHKQLPSICSHSSSPIIICLKFT